MQNYANTIYGIYLGMYGSFLDAANVIEFCNTVINIQKLKIYTLL